VLKQVDAGLLSAGYADPQLPLAARPGRGRGTIRRSRKATGRANHKC